MKVPSSRPATPRIVLHAALAALAVELLGFGALTIFWLVGDHDPRLPGLFTYRAASFGDGLLLPVLAGCLVAGLENLREHKRTREIWWALLAGLAGFTIGAVAQFLWLFDDHPATNWTLPEPHVLTTAGWYHAAFMSSALAAFSALFTTLARRFRALPRDHTAVQHLSRSPFTPALFGAVLGFGCLVVRDLTTVNAGASQTITIALLAGGLTASLGVLVLLGIGHARALLPSLATGLLFGSGLALSVDAMPDATPSLMGWTSLVCVCLALAACEPIRQTREPRRRAQWAMGVLGATLVLLGFWRISLVGDEYLTGAATYSLVYVLLGPLLVFGFVRGLSVHPKSDRAWFSPFQAIGPLIYLSLAGGLAEWPDFSPGKSEVILGLLAPLLPLALLRANFKDIVAAENAFRADRGDPEIALALMERRTQSAWLVMALSTLAGLVAIVKIATTFTDLAIGAPAAELDELLPTVVSGLAALCICGGAVLVARPRRPDDISLGASPTLCWILGIGVGIWFFAPVWTARTEVQYGAAALAAGVIVFLFHAETLFTDVGRLNGIKLPRRARAVLAWTALAIGANVVWLISHGAWSHGDPVSTEVLGDAALLVLLIGGILSTFVGHALHRTSAWGRLTIEPVEHNLRQNVLLFHFAVLIAIASVPVAQRVEAPGPALLVISLLFVVLSLGGVVPRLKEGFLWTAIANADHVAMERANPPWQLLHAAVARRQGVRQVTADGLNVERLRVMAMHMEFMILASACIVVGGWSWLVSYLWLSDEQAILGIAVPVSAGFYVLIYIVRIYRKQLTVGGQDE